MGQAFFKGLDRERDLKDKAERFCREVLMKIGIYQMMPVFGKKEENLKMAISDLKNVKADLVVLPELFNTGYQFLNRAELMELSEEIPDGMTCRGIMELSKKTGTYYVFGLAERDGDKLFNSAVIVGPEGYMGKYRKTHLFYEEKELFCPGDTGFRVFDINIAKIGIMICFDWWFPESCRALAILGANIICHPSNLVMPYCQMAMQIRSLENGVYTATANRIGYEQRGGKERLSFSGMSQIVDPWGKVLKRMGKEESGVAVCEIDPQKANFKEINRFNDRLKDRRPEFYKSLVDVY